MKKSLAELNEDNFFLTLSHGDDFIQAAFSSSNKFNMEYRDGTGHYSAAKVLQRKNTEAIFVAYIQKNDKWKTMSEWKKM